MKLHLTPILLLAGGMTCIPIKVWLEHRTQEIERAQLTLKPIEAGYHGQSLKRYDMGFDNLTAALIWVQLLQLASHEKVESDQVSWEFAQLDAITTLDPEFKAGYSFGASFLSVFRRDKLGAKLLIEKWVRRTPRNWRSHYLYGYHLFYELGEYAEAAEYILKASKMEGAPNWLSVLGVRLLSQTGALMQAMRVSLELYETVTDIEIRYRLRGRIRSLNFAIQESLWEKALAQYRAMHHEDPSDSAALQPFVQDQARGLSSILAAAEVAEEEGEMLKERFSFRYDAQSHTIIPEKDPKALGIERLGIYPANEKKKSAS